MFKPEIRYRDPGSINRQRNWATGWTVRGSQVGTKPFSKSIDSIWCPARCLYKGKGYPVSFLQKLLLHKFLHSVLSSAELKNYCGHTSSPLIRLQVLDRSNITFCSLEFLKLKMAMEGVKNFLTKKFPEIYLSSFLIRWVSSSFCYLPEYCLFLVIYRDFKISDLSEIASC